MSAAPNTSTSGAPPANQASRFGRANADAPYDRPAVESGVSNDPASRTAPRSPYGNPDARNERPYQTGTAASRWSADPAEATTEDGSPAASPALATHAPGESGANRVQAAAAADPSLAGRSASMPNGNARAITNQFVSQEPVGRGAPRETSSSLLPATPAKIDAANPPIALDGHCPVTLYDQEKWVKGDARFGARHRGRTYLFASKQHAEKFFANPDQYSPVLSGYDPILLLEGKQWVAGERQHGIWLEKNRMYLFSSEQTLKRFWEEREQWVPLAEQAMQEQAANRVR
jgi:YHS domain-containing protein